MSGFGRREGGVPQVALGMEPTDEPPRPSTFGSVLARIWALSAGVLAVTIGFHGVWVSALVLMAHAALVWPEVAAWAHREGGGRLRGGLAWTTLLAASVAAFLQTALTVPPAPMPANPVAALPTTPQPLAVYRAKILGHAVMEIDRSDFDASLYRKLGSRRVRDANALAPWVALRASLSPRCDTVDLVEVAGDADRTKLRWFVDCSNRQRFYVDEQDAAATRTRFSGVGPNDMVTITMADLPRSENQKVEGFDEGTGIEMCELAMKSILQSSGSYRPSGAARTTLHPQRGRVSIVRRFTAANAMSAQLDSQWDCLIDAGSMEIVELKWLDGGEWRTVSR